MTHNIAPCMDCAAHLRKVNLTNSLTVLQVIHDDTCPALHHLEPA